MLLTYLFLLSHEVHCVKSVCIRSLSGLFFLAFGLNTERCISPYSVQMRENTDEEISNMDTFHVLVSPFNKKLRGVLGPCQTFMMTCFGENS